MNLLVGTIIRGNQPSSTIHPWVFLCSEDHPNSYWQCCNVLWDDGATDLLSPWDMEALPNPEETDNEEEEEEEEEEGKKKEKDK